MKQNLKSKILQNIKSKLNKTLYSINLFPFLNFDWTTGPENLTSFQQLIYGIIIISISLLWCFINVTGYFITIYVIKYTDIETKYPKYIKIINYFKKYTYLSIILEILFIVITLLSLIGICCYILWFN
uniref:hypothetical protein n=1 Tax=Hericium alpestre TaxID=135208 RepID=UPI00243573C5|nr:hypothetical protein QEO35_mgp28 [Hericium alpestre]WEX32005.1 hypothetical protein [Hericium alpestre]